ncbi:MAG: DMT family transporter [Vampirovibrionales bacterium]
MFQRFTNYLKHPQTCIPFLLITMTLIYGAFFPLQKLFCLHVHPMEAAVLRQLGFGVIILIGGWFWGFWQRDWKQLPPHWPWFVFCGLLGVFYMQITAALAVPMTTSFHATLMMGTIPLQTAIINNLLGYEKLSTRAMLGITLGMAGVAWLVLEQLGVQGDVRSTGTNPLVGNVLILINAFIFSVYTIAVRRLVQHHSPVRILSFNFLQAGLYMLLLLGVASSTWLPPTVASTLPTFASTWQALTHLDALSWWLLMYMVVFAGFVGYLIHHLSLKYVTSNKVVTYHFVQPVLAAGLGHWWFNEPFTLPMACAAVLVLAGVVTASKAPVKN